MSAIKVRMNKTIKKKWLKALRSGRYKQGKQYLRNSDNTYCCLGVLAKVMGRRWRKDSSGIDYALVDKSCTLNLDGVCLLPPAVMEAARINPKIQNYLSTKNDSGDWPFNRIADWIERHL